jgi:hypothetical protein
VKRANSSLTPRQFNRKRRHYPVLQQSSTTVTIPHIEITFSVRKDKAQPYVLEKVLLGKI